jgi:hypothetical protein
MLSVDESRQELTAFFRSQPCADLQVLFKVLKTQVRMSVFRRLSAVGYFSSFTHVGRYYTLRDIPQFDTDGLWYCQGVGFSQYGSLKATVAHMIAESDAGRTHFELQARLRVRVHNTLLDLVRGKQIGRETFEGLYLYVSADPERAGKQLASRGRRQEGIVAVPLPPSVVIEVLLELVQGAKALPVPELVAARLSARGLTLTLEQIEAVFTKYGVKKTEPSRS